jgi:hypothetical protein
MSLKFINHKTAFILAAIAVSIFGMTAGDYFHTAAQQYINGSNQLAKATIDDGLKQFPNDPELSALKAKIKDEQNKQDQKNKQDQDKKDQDKKNQDKKDQNKQDQSKKDQQKQDQDKKEQEKKEQEKKDQQNQNAQNDKKDQDKPQPQPKDNKQDMKKEEAKRLIMQFADDADSLNKPPKKEGVAAKARKPEKDW